MTRHRLTAAALIAPLVLAVGCTSSSKHSTSTSTSSTQGSGSSTGSGSAASSGAHALQASMHTALTSVTSTAVTIDAGGLIAATTGHITLDNGSATASDITIGTGADATRVITVGSTAYAKLPAGQNTTGKPYLKVSESSSNEFVRGLASDLQILQATYSLGDLVDLLASATGFTDNGATQLAGAAAHEYSFDVVGDAQGSNLQKQLASLASAPVPVQLWTNAQNLPVKVVLTVKIGGASLPVTATLGSFNALVTITAPPSSEVSG